MLGVTRRKLQTPGTAEEHKRQETPTSNPIDRQPARLTDQAPRTVERAARETHKTNYHSSCACFTTTATRHHHPHPTGSSPDPLSQRSPLRSLGALHRRAEPHHTTDTTHLSGDTQRPPHLGGPSSGVADGQPRAHGLLLSKGRWRGEGGGGEYAAIRTQTPERAASAEPGAKAAPRRGRDFRQDHQLELAAQASVQVVPLT